MHLVSYNFFLVKFYYYSVTIIFLILTIYAVSYLLMYIVTNLLNFSIRVKIFLKTNFHVSYVFYLQLNLNMWRVLAPWVVSNLPT